jgi:flavorubredoxin
MHTSMVTNPQSRTNIHEIGDGIYRINTPIDLPDGRGFSFNQYLVLDDEPLLFHTGPRRLFPLVREAVAGVMPVERLRYVGLSHFEADECGSLDLWLVAAPAAVAVCSQVGAMVSIADVVDRAPRAMADGEQLVLGRHTLQWLDTPHVPHGWDCGLMVDLSTDTFFCGDLFTQPGHGDQPLTEGDILGPSEAFRQPMDYYAHAPHTAATLARLAQLKPTTLACMHGSAWRGDGGALLRHLGEAVTARA